MKYKTVVAALALLSVMNAQAKVYSYKAPDGSIMFTDEPVKGAKTVKIEKPMVIPAVKINRNSTADTITDTRPAVKKPLWPEPGALVVPRAKPVAEVAPAVEVVTETTSWNSDTQGLSSSGSGAVVTKLAPESIATQQLEVTTVPSVQPKSPETYYKKFTVISPSSHDARWVGGELSVELALDPSLKPEHVVVLDVDGNEVALSPSTKIVVPRVDRGNHVLSASVVNVDTGETIIKSRKIDFQVHRPVKKRK